MARGHKAEALLTRLSQHCHGVTLKPTRAQGHARLLATEAVAEGFSTIIAAGGDGTVNEVVNGLVDAEGGLQKSQLGILPIGTVNVFARELGIPSDWHEAFNVIRVGRERAIDVPCVEFQGNRGREKRSFIQLAGAGWDARTIQLTTWKMKKRFGFFSYVVSGLKVLGEPGHRVRVETPQESATGQLVLIGNGRFYAGSYPVFHRASNSDGLLDVCVFDRFDWTTFPHYALKLLTCRLFRPGGYTYFQTKEVTLTAATDAGLELEGEWVGGLPAHFYMNPDRLRVVVP